MRFEAGRVDLGAAIGFSFVVIGQVGESTLDLADGDVSEARGADNCDVEGGSAGISEVVDDDTARASVVFCNHTRRLVFNDDSSGVEDR